MLQSTTSDTGGIVIGGQSIFAMGRTDTNSAKGMSF